MMGQQAKGRQLKMFYQGLCLERRVRPDHPLRRVKQLVDFDFIYQEDKPFYGVNGNVSVPPPVILKLMLLLVFYNVRSERELMATLPERLDWLWFIDFDLDDEIPGHSVLSKARSRWGPAAFKHFFERIVWQCVAAGLVDGAKIFMDSSLIQADASNNSIIKLNSLKSQLNRHYRELEARLEELPADGKGKGQLNRTHLSTTDPDASLVSQGKVRSQLSFTVHRAVDSRSEVITATQVTSGAVNEGHLLPDLMEQHTENTASQVEVVVADSQYGTIANYLECHDRGLKAHISPFKDGQNRNGKFSEEAFTYDPQDDVYLCPGGQRLRRDTISSVRPSNTKAGARAAGPAPWGTSAPGPRGAEPSGAICGRKKSGSCVTGRSPSGPKETSEPASISWREALPGRCPMALSGLVGAGSGGSRSKSTSRPPSRT
jgi:transposase